MPLPLHSSLVVALPLKMGFPVLNYYSIINVSAKIVFTCKHTMLICFHSLILEWDVKAQSQVKKLVLNAFKNINLAIWIDDVRIKIHNTVDMLN